MIADVPPADAWSAAVVRAIVARRWPDGSTWVDGVGQVRADELRKAAREYHHVRARGKGHMPALRAAADVLTPGWRGFVHPESREVALRDARRVVALVVDELPRPQGVSAA